MFVEGALYHDHATIVLQMTTLLPEQLNRAE